ncbi:hypothetical protein IW261DRAFT_1564526 [Armillaria novae-zelandiae]|uniref:Heterokaryon incompatibility domain-containing protein n=1 Tax=Armillaria novae-zelandiae TaxID=153914 RepID=A0AA39P8A6_9AGAR|nr:hypothetical protein IW261DRAFT_1564526 [Armillaria novae-zelandiae]
MDSEPVMFGMASTSEGRFTQYWAPFKVWRGRKKWFISDSWQNKKISISKWFAHSEVSLWYDKGITSVCDNAPELNKVVRRCPPIYHEYPNLREITLTALTETGCAESTIPVLNQRSYTGNKPVISSVLADILCADLGIDGVLKKLNATLGSSYSLDSKAFRPLRKMTLRAILTPYVARNDDFGMVYSHLRHLWYGNDVARMEHALRTREEKDRQRRKKVLVHGRITRSDVPPRRVWDLYANRVLPYWDVVRAPQRISRMWGISHAWVDENDRMGVMTPINGHEWPVPMPKDANLDLIRIEMLNPGAEYAWLDVLCLRQQGGKGEHLRLEEWKLDVPTIGFVYSHAARVVCYFNGLGRSLHLTRDYFESDRCWFRRAWTLQELTDDAIIGGETGDNMMEQEVQKMFDERLAHLREIREQFSTLKLVLEMRNRVSSKPLDKVAGLAYLLHTDYIPIYDVEMSDADAWEVLMDVMSPLSRVQVFFYFPEPGNGRKYWRPSWQQIMTTNHHLHSSIWGLRPVENGDTDQDWYNGYFINSADVRGLDEGLQEGMPRQGEMFIKNAAGVSCPFKILADHVYLIPDGSYAVVGADYDGPCVIGWLREDRKFDKLSVFRLADDERENFRKLGLESEFIILS